MAQKNAGFRACARVIAREGRLACSVDSQTTAGAEAGVRLCTRSAMGACVHPNTYHRRMRVQMPVTLERMNVSLRLRELIMERSELMPGTWAVGS